MATLFVRKTLVIHALTSKVWDVLTKPEYTSKWIIHFSPKIVLLESTWKKGSPVLWKEKNGKVDVQGMVTAMKPQSLLRFTVAPADSQVDVTYSEDDGITFKLEGRKGYTHLSVTQGDFAKVPEHAKYADLTSRVWDHVLPIVQQLAESTDKQA